MEIDGGFITGSDLLMDGGVTASELVWRRHRGARTGMTKFAEELGRRESRVVRCIRQACIAVLCLYAVSFAWSIYRRINQVLRIEARASSLVLQQFY